MIRSIINVAAYFGVTNWLGWQEPGNRLLVVLIIVTAIVGIMGPFLVYQLQRQKLPKLEVGGLYKFQIASDFTYTIKVTKSGGEGIAKEVEGFIKIGEGPWTKSFWGRDISKTFQKDITRDSYLVLFLVSNQKILVPEFHNKGWTYSDPYPLSDYLDSRIQVGIDSTNARISKTKNSDTVREIIEKAELIDVTT